MRNILITGGSGLIGNAITKLLEEGGSSVAWLSRNAKDKPKKTFSWDIQNQEMDNQALEWCNAIIHLAGAGIADKRWTEDRKKEIMESRTKSTKLLFDTLKTMDKKPQVIICASAVGFYGTDTGEELIYEGHPAGNDFLAQVVKKWESEAAKFYSLGIRTVKLRTGIVLAEEGGVLPEIMKPPVAAPLGDGNQYISWIHLRDLAKMYIHILNNSGIVGIYNAVGPDPVTNKELTRSAAKWNNKPYVNFGVPAFALKLFLGEMANMVLGGNRVSNEKIKGTGFQYDFTDLDVALKEIYNHKHEKR